MDQKLKNQRYQESMKSLEEAYSKFEVARWFCLGEEDGRTRRAARGPINRKMLPEGHNDSRGASVIDVVCAQLLAFLHEEGYDLGMMRYDDEGRLIEMGKRPVKRKT